MTESPRRGVTRGYVWGLIGAALIIAVAVTVAVWGLLGLATARQPVETPGVPPGAAPVIVFVALLALAWALWLQSLQLLRGRRTPPWAHTLTAAVSAYLIWGLGGVLLGLTVTDTWLSPFAALLTPIWAFASLLCWAILARRVYTDKPPPQWPWERRGEPGPDWGDGQDPWGGQKSE